MESMVPVNEMLKEEITKLDYTLTPPGFQGDARKVRMMQESLTKLIDSLGEQSAVAQGLSKCITTGEKLRNSLSHTLYVLKDAAAKGGRGEVIGLLKVGRKHLFLFDTRNKVWEVEPMCVLDFYVVRDRQRHGHGRHLFDYMLKDTGTSAQELAIDGPSTKMEQFLAKSYGVDQLVRQNNNFAVSPSFFNNMAEISKYPRQILGNDKKRVELNPIADRSKRVRATPAVQAAAVGRFAAQRRPSAIGNVIHGGGGSQHDANNGDSGRATPDADFMLEENFHEKWMTEKLVDKHPTPEEKLEVIIPEMEEKMAKLVVEVQRPSSLPVGAPAPAPAPAAPLTPAAGAPSPAGSTVSRRDSQLTERGFFDVKFYHNKLW